MELKERIKRDLRRNWYVSESDIKLLLEENKSLKKTRSILMKTLIATILISISIIFSGCNTNNALVPDRAAITVDGGAHVKYTSPDGIVDKIIIPPNMQFNIAPEGYVEVHKINRQINIALFAGNEVVDRRTGFGYARIDY